MIIKLFTKHNCPKCPVAKSILTEYKAQNASVKVEEFDVETVDGMAEGAFYGIMATPSIVVCDNQGKEQFSWRGETPDRGELQSKVGQ